MPVFSSLLGTAAIAVLALFAPTRAETNGERLRRGLSPLPPRDFVPRPVAGQGTRMLPRHDFVRARRATPSSTPGAPTKYVSVIIIDGLQAADIDIYQINPSSTIYGLSRNAITYTNARTTYISDSFPSLWESGAGPGITGSPYDDHYNRNLFPAGSDCSGTPGTIVQWTEAIDVNSNTLNTTISPALLPRALKSGVCSPVYPHETTTTPSAFNVVKNNGGVTAYSDKHPAYEVVTGPSGDGLTDFYFPESNAIAKGIAPIEAYDRYHTQAMTNWVGGEKADGTGPLAHTPNVYGTSFQSLNVAQKLQNNAALGGGYFAGNVPNTATQSALSFLDSQIAAIIAAQKASGTYPDTLNIIVGKHGNDPRHPSVAVNKIDPARIEGVIGPENYVQIVLDDVAVIWLKDQSQTANVTATLTSYSGELGIKNIISGSDLANFQLGDPTNIGQYPATPDILVEVNPGVIYTTSTSKFAEHGGNHDDDLSVGLILHNPAISKQVINDQLYSQAVAPIVLKWLGLDQSQLTGAVEEGITYLPGTY